MAQAGELWMLNPFFKIWLDTLIFKFNDIKQKQTDLCTAQLLSMGLFDWDAVAPHFNQEKGFRYKTIHSPQISLTCTNKLSHTFSKPRPSLIILLILFKASIQQVYYHYLFGWIMHSKLLKGIRRFHLRKYLKICIFVPSYEYKVFCHIDNRTLNTLCTYIF